MLLRAGRPRARAAGGVICRRGVDWAGDVNVRHVSKHMHHAVDKDPARTGARAPRRGAQPSLGGAWGNTALASGGGVHVQDCMRVL